MLRKTLKISRPLPLCQGKCQDFMAGHSGTGCRKLPSVFMARSDCMEGGRGPGTGAGMGAGSTVHIVAGPGPGMGAENIMLSCLHVLETTLFWPCAHVLIILQ